MGDIKQSASASATGQVGVVNVEGGLSFSLSPEFKTSGFIGSLLAPRRARKSAEAAKEINDAVAESMATYMSLSPTVSPERAYLMAMTGLMFTERQTENLLAVLSSAAESAGGVADPSVIPSMTRDKILNGSCEADDENVRGMWERLILGEMDSPGMYSKRTMSILSDMSGAEASSFRHLCGVCIKSRLDGRQTQRIYYPFNIPNELALESQEADSLRALGLTTLSGSNGVMSAMSIRFSDKPTILKIGNCAYSVTSDRARSIEVASDPLTSYGQELSTLCDIGTYDGFEQYVMGILEKLGADVTRVKWQTE